MRKGKSIYLAFSVMLLMTALSATVPAQIGDFTDSRPKKVALVAILANPAAYHGQSIMVEGVAKFEFEGDALFLTREHRYSFIFTNAIWVNARDEGWDMDRLAELDGKYVAVTGRLNAKARGHLGLFGASLEQISAVRPLE